MAGGEKASRERGRAVWEQRSGRLWRLRALVGRLGGRPDFLLLGAQRAGTTSLFEWLDGHRGVRMARPKEVHYFDFQHHRGEGWYRSHFLPPRLGRVRGEASPYYLYHPLVPGRVRAELPEVKLVVVLRDPVQRAHSQFRHERQGGFEELADFEQALDAEEQRTAGEAERLCADPVLRSHSHNHHSYVDRGRYVHQLRRWLELFPREQLHVLFSEELFAAPGPTLGELAAFLGIAAPARAELPRANAAPGPALPEELRQRLERTFEADDAALAELLGRPLPWRAG